LLASTLLALVIAEGGLRLAHPLWAIPYPPRSYRPGLFEPWDCCGYRLRRSRVFRDRYPFPGGTFYTITANADGFRSRRELDEPDPRPRVLVLGDSMIFGTGVEEPDRVTERLEAAEPGWRVDNLGMIGFGPDLMLRALEAEGLATHPAVVVLAMFSHDVYRVIPEMVGAGFPLPRYELRDGALITVPYPQRPWWMRLYLVQGLRYVVFRYTAATFPLNEAILTRFRALAQEHNFVPAIVFVPGPRQRFDDHRRARWLAGWAATAGIPFLDLTAPLAAAGGEGLYLPRDTHWNRDGHATASAALRPFIAKQVATRHAFSALRGISGDPTVPRLCPW
jgi:hypothetical protein